MSRLEVLFQTFIQSIEDIDMTRGGGASSAPWIWIARPSIELHSSLETYGVTIRPTPATRIDNVQLTGGSILSYYVYHVIRYYFIIIYMCTLQARVGSLYIMIAAV